MSTRPPTSSPVGNLKRNYRSRGIFGNFFGSTRDIFNSRGMLISFQAGEILLSEEYPVHQVFVIRNCPLKLLEPEKLAELAA